MSQTELFPHTTVPFPAPTMAKRAKGVRRKPLHPVIEAARTKARRKGEEAADGCTEIVGLARLVFETQVTYIAQTGQPMKPSDMRAITGNWASRAGDQNVYGTRLSKTLINGWIKPFALLAAAVPNSWQAIDDANGWLRANGKQTRLPVSHLNRLVQVALYILDNLPYQGPLSDVELTTNVWAPKTKAQRTATQIYHALRDQIINRIMPELPPTHVGTAQDLIDKINADYP